jgi:antimicrobial peptide system SdpA family protein
MRRLIFICWLTLGVIVFLASFKAQIILDNKIQKQINYIFPEGWGFFTKNPRDLLMDVYRIEDHGITRVDMSNHSWSNKFGLSRKVRVIGYESSIIIAEIPNYFWKEGTLNNAFIHVKDSTLTVKSPKHFNHLTNGEYLFKIYKQIPYAWAKKGQEQYTPSKFAKIRIE